ncbi:hypothetical protein [Pseudoalteromonas luteoviolacea]|uniref:CHAT domain-containing protein n=1 Tax=Pseudoalteromonas luteoviolacea NCIMB 1942 TaxID=1365253 RepID=A0A167BCY2_9GAMM|nr:hypothetical protein [Pseudoalteromonas luteoviolacea]KZN46389.1 hypothetical protein N482_12865 [Pseudoalteromonas luteoviolacea NCIMB 1942]KZX01578.1 hypothetical protein JL49_04230 [Pseudoalteromonas luteoviolacea]
MKISLLFIFLCSLLVIKSAVGSEHKTLYLSLDTSNKHVLVKATLGNRVIRYSLDELSQQTRSNFDSVLMKLNSWELDKAFLKQAIGRYESTLLTPIASLLDKATHIHFVLDKGSFDFALDLISYKGQPLFLQYPVSFSYKPVKVAHEYRFDEQGNGLIVKDKTTDPENASLLISEILSNTKYYEMEDMKKEQLTSKGGLDIALLSLHGIADEREAFMQLNDEQIRAVDLQNLNSKLLYLDSCQMGSSYSFSAKLAQSSTQFIVAPLFDNEAGGSSSLTIKSFFTKLSQNISPGKALYLTRKALFNRFSKAENFTSAIWKAYPFRVIQVR